MCNRRIPVLLAGAALLWAVGCGSAASSPRSPAATATSAPAPTAASAEPAPTPARAVAQPAVVRVSNTSGLASPLQLAAARGYFQEQGIDLQREEFGSAAEAIVPLTTGDLDAGSVTPNASFFNAVARGIRLNLALAGSHVQPGTGGFPLMSRSGADGPVVAEPRDLRGKRIGQNQRGVINEWALDRMLADAGLALTDVELLVMPFPDVLASFGGGTVDAAILPEPFGTLARERGLAVQVGDGDDYIAGGQVAAIGFSERFATQRPEVARRWAVAYLRGVRDFMDAMEHGRDREGVIGTLAQLSGFDPAILAKAGYFPIRRDGRVNAEALQAMLDWLVDRGYVPQKPDLAPLLDTQFADYAQQALEVPR